MARDRTARARIRNYLVSHGPLEDSSGHVTGVLKDEIHYEGSSVAFIQLIAAMDKSGEIVRDIRGKRTYRIAAGESAETAAAPTVVHEASAAAAPATAAPLVVSTEAGPVAIDYDKLARALVREFRSILTGEEPVDSSAEDLRVERERVVAERDDYARRLEQARVKLDELLGAPAPRADAGVRQ